MTLDRQYSIVAHRGAVYQRIDVVGQAIASWYLMTCDGTEVIESMSVEESLELERDYIDDIMDPKQFRIGDMESSSTRALIDDDTNEVIGVALTNCGSAYHGKLTLASTSDRGGYDLIGMIDQDGRTVYGKV